jgi:hypothetical protein
MSDAMPSKDNVERQVLWLLAIAFVMSVISIALMVIAILWKPGQDYGPIMLMTGGTTNIFMQAFVFWPLSSYILRREPSNRVYSGLVKHRHILFLIASATTLIASAIGIIWRGR